MKIKNNSILVTGAEGFIGSHLCEKLSKKGANVKALVLYNSFNQEGWLEDIPSNIKNSIEVIPGDVRDQELIKKITKNVELIFHLAALISIPYSYNAPRSYLNTNILGTLNILEAAKLVNVKKLFLHLLVRYMEQLRKFQLMRNINCKLNLLMLLHKNISRLFT